MPTAPLGRIGRYLLYEEIAVGGTATVYLGRLQGSAGFSRVVALKRLHESLAKDENAIAMVRDEAWLSTRVRHPNVVSILDVVEENGEIVLAMDYVEGAPLSNLIAGARAAGRALPIPIVAAIVVRMLAGLEAAHSATAEDGTPLGLIHRDVSPQNVLVGFDGSVLLADFGVAKAHGRSQKTRDGVLKGKFAYMAPEQLEGKTLSARTDLYAAGTVLWECLTGVRLHTDEEPAAIVTSILYGDEPNIADHRPEVPDALREVLRRALARAPEDRFASAAEMAKAIEDAVGVASKAEIAELTCELLAEERKKAQEARARVELATDEEAPSLHRMPKSADPPVATGAALELTVPIARARRGSSRTRVAIAALAIGVVAALGFGVTRLARTPPGTTTNAVSTREESAPPPPPPVTTSLPEPPAEPPPAPSASASVDPPPRTAPRPPARPAALPSASTPRALRGIPSDRE